MKFQLIYFTGTGNTKRVELIAKNALIKQGHQVTEIDVTKDLKPSLPKSDALIIFYPIYAFNAPKPIINYVKKIPKLKQRIPCIIMKQSGEHLFWNNASSLYLTRLLKKKNIIVTNEYHYLMPYSFIFRHSDYMAYKMYDTMAKLVPIDLERFFKHQKVKVKRFFLGRLFALTFRIQWFGGRFNGLFYKVEKDKCIKCQKCLDNCPAKNIKEKQDKIKFGFHCLMCQRCIMHCPTHAIKAGLFNGWRVDEPYDFKEAPYQKEIKPNFCKKNYQKYFNEANDVIAKYQENNKRY